MSGFSESYQRSADCLTRNTHHNRLSLPADIAEYLDQLDCRSYENGFFDFRRPDLMLQTMKFWNIPQANTVPIVKLGFGHVIYFCNQSMMMIDPVSNRVDQIAERPSGRFFFDILLTDRAAMESAFYLDRYRALLPLLGAVGEDEIYGFVPAIGLGGAMTNENIKKRPFISEMMILSQT
jgi:hypothetical protein